MWIEFITSTNIKAKYFVEGNKVTKVKLISKVPKSYYYSCLNDAGIEADEHYITNYNQQ